ncbi:UNVERIFIED_CONTAM: hypothetical protein Sradi_6434200 [Sesamum radiatum]|uniref:Reverse transcriptase Ty1/copia-type domain-containing protein n=1 Tax=Sesamum radiatum TaxID=300843 RepID=A0AAW2K3X4_SESRA
MVIHDHLKENGIVSQWIPPGTPQLNGVAERRNRTLLDMECSILGKGLPADTRRDELLLEKSSKAPQSNAGTTSPTVSTNNVLVLRRLARVPRPPQSMSSSQVWTLVDQPKGVKSIGCLWQKDILSDLVDLAETFSPIAIAKSIRIMLAIATWYDYEIWQMDLKMAFLNDFVEEEIYMDKPNGFTVVGEEQKVCHLQRAIYGLKQAS